MRCHTALVPHVHLVCQTASQAARLSNTLLTAGFLVSVSTTPRQARHRLEQQTVDALILVGPEPGSSSLRLLEQLIAQDHPPQVILLGRQSNERRLERFVSQGRVEYLRMSIAPETVTRTLQRLMRLSGHTGKPPRREFHSSASQPFPFSARDDRRRRHDRLVAVHRFSQAISSTLNVDEIISIAFGRLSELVKVGLLGISWTPGPFVWVRATEGVPAARVDALRRMLTTCTHALPRVVENDRGTLRPFDPVGGQQARNGATLAIPLTAGSLASGWLHVERIEARPFTAGERELLRAIASWIALALRNADAHRHIKNLALTDALTGLLNRRAFDDHLARTIRTTERYGSQACLIVADLDHFKQLNDQLGHLKGDAILKAVATVITNSVRSVDIVARYGGEEFGILLPHTSLKSATILAERLRCAIEQRVAVSHGDCLHVTVSLGIAGIPCPGIATAQDLIAAADRALYRAKALGRNRVESTELDADPSMADHLLAAPGR